MEKLNVCLMNDSFPPAIDGVANAVTNYARIITQNHGEASVVTPYYPDADDGQFDLFRTAVQNLEKDASRMPFQKARLCFLRLEPVSHGKRMRIRGPLLHKALFFHDTLCALGTPDVFCPL